METSWLIERLENPLLLEKGDEQRLRELIASYPYFSAPYLLLARSLHEQKHPAFEQLLPLISLQAFDRKRLFRLIHDVTMDHRPWTIGEVERKVVPAAGVESEAEVEEIASIPRFAVNFSEVEKTEEEHLPAVHEELQEIPFLLTMDHEPSTFEDKPAGAENVLSKPQVDVEKKVGVEELKGLGDEEERRPGEEENELVREEEKSPNHKSQIINHKSDRIDFIHWLEKLQPVDKVEVEKIEGKGDGVKVRHTERSRSAADLQNPEPITHNPEPITQNPESLIDKFIQTNPSISRVKERFYDPAVQAKESERLDDSIMTETLARIFVKQEKYERAIEAYRKLQLKYPEKSDYFAALILEINSKIN